MPSPYLSKSDFKACFDCRTKLYYRKHSYPTNLDENEYLKFLADGGFMIETVAKAKYPQGQDLAAERNHEAAFEQTKKLLNASDQAVIFEAAVIHEKYLARIDILRREGNTLHLIEVKSSSINSEDEADENDAASTFLGKKGANKGLPTAKWKPYLLDVAFQAHVLRSVFPKFEVIPWLCVVDKSHRATTAETLDKFVLQRDPADPKARPSVTYVGNLNDLKDSKLLIERNVTAETNLIMPEVVARAIKLAGLLGPPGIVQREQENLADIYKHCRKCEYRFKADRAPQPHGFAECWGPMAQATPHILDLHRVTQIGTSKIPDPVPDLVDQGNASLLNLTEDQLGNDGAWQARRHLQWSHSHDGGQEHLPTALTTELVTHKDNPGWPLHFLDFEACNVALPHHAGLRPYEQVAFQWSCHTLDGAGNLTHREWLNTTRDFPNFAFAQTLRQQLGDAGTVYVWSSYEQSTLNRVLMQIDGWLQRDAVEALRLSGLSDRTELEHLANWIGNLLGSQDDKGKWHNSPRIRDLHKLALEHYFHPAMLGRTSIKVVLPAVWQQNPALREHQWFKQYLGFDAHSQPIDPYKTLPPLPLGDEDDKGDTITDGTGAIRVYQDLIFRSEEDPDFKANREQLLKQYCQLDTAAMVMIWQHWNGCNRPASKTLT